VTGSSAFDGVMERTSRGGAIRFERRLPFPVAAVWDAITNPERLADWWLPSGADVSIDLRPGGAMVFTGRGDDPSTVTATVITVDAPVLFEHTHIVPGSTMRWQLEAADGGCVLRVTQFVDDVDAAIGNCWIVGLHTSLARLEPILIGSPTAWDPILFAAAQIAYSARGAAAPTAT